GHCCAQLAAAFRPQIYGQFTLQYSLQSGSPDVRELACASISKLVQEKMVIPSFLQKDAVRCLGPMLLDPSVAVRETAAGALRNLSACGGFDVCDEMVKRGIMTPLIALLRECCTGLDANMAVLQKGKGAQKNYVEDIANEAIHLLWNLCESSSRAVFVFNKEGLLDVCLQCLRQFSTNVELALSAAYCLQAVTEDNAELLAALSPSALQVLEVVLLSSKDTTEHLLLQTLVAGTVWNVKSLIPPSRNADTINAIVKILSNTLEMNANQVILSLKEAECAASKVLGETDTEEDIIAEEEEEAATYLEDGTQKASKLRTTKKITNDDISDLLPSEELRHATALLSAQQTALEIIVNMCCSEDPSDDEWEEMSSSDESDYSLCTENYITEGTGALCTPLCLSAEVHSALMNCLIPKKVLEKTTFPDTVTVNICMNSQPWRHLITKMKRIQCRALTCLHNILSVLDVEGLGGPVALQALSQHLAQLIFSQTELPKDSEFLEAVTGAMRSLFQIMASQNLSQSMSPEQLMALCEAVVQCENASARVNAVAMLGIGGSVLAKEENTAETLKMMGSFLVQVATKDCSLVVVGEALDAIIDVFADGKEADKAADQIKLVQTLKSFQPVFKARMRKEGKGNYGPDQLLVLDNVKMNLRRFIAYREALPN
uniref:HEAT repeat containing 3 n=1 Tax=Callorhinchus milii TaxID=7868 RepID=A0A4W3JRW4_CALMI